MRQLYAITWYQKRANGLAQILETSGLPDKCRGNVFEGF